MECCSISADCLNHSYEFSIPILKLLDCLLITVHKHQCTFTHSHLNSFLIHIVDVLRYNIVLCDDLSEYVKKSCDVRSIEHPCSATFQTCRPSCLELWMSGSK